MFKAVFREKILSCSFPDTYLGALFGGLSLRAKIKRDFLPHFLQGYCFSYQNSDQGAPNYYR